MTEMRERFALAFDALHLAFGLALLAVRTLFGFESTSVQFVPPEHAR